MPFIRPVALMKIPVQSLPNVYCIVYARV